jgi:CRP-like cAMP-binding protein
MPQSITAILSVTEIFDNLTPDQLESVSTVCEKIALNEGHFLIKENERSTDLYVIARGGVEIVINPSFVSNEPDTGERMTLTELRQGQVLGEVALVDEGIRTASVRVSQDNTILLKIPRDQLMQLCDTNTDLGYKVMKNVAADLAFKIRNTDLTLRQYQMLLNQQKQ